MDTTVHTSQIQDLFEQEIVAMLSEAKTLREQITQSKTQTKKSYYKKKLDRLSPMIDRAINMYEVVQHEQAKRNEASKENQTPED